MGKRPMGEHRSFHMRPMGEHSRPMGEPRSSRPMGEHSHAPDGRATRPMGEPATCLRQGRSSTWPDGADACSMLSFARCPHKPRRLDAGGGVTVLTPSRVGSRGARGYFPGSTGTSWMDRDGCWGSSRSRSPARRAIVEAHGSTLSTVTMSYSSVAAS
jgi:hypothetical protein